MNPILLTALGKLAAPAIVSVTIFALFYLGGDAFQDFGLAAVDTTRHVLKYVLGIAAFLSLAVLAQRLLRYVVFDGLILSATGTPVPKLLSQISGLLIFIVAISACAGIVFEQDLTVLWAASGVAGLVLGMALRELLQDVFAGIALNIDRAVRIGDFLRLHNTGDGGISGQLLEISWRTTRVKDFMGDVVIVPNSRFSGLTITNFSQPEPVSFRAVTLSLDARVPPERALRILQAGALDALAGLVGTTEITPAPWAEVKAIKPDGVEYGVYFKAEWRHLANARPLILQRILSHLAQAGLEPAVPRQEAGATATADAGLRAQGPDPARLAALLGATALFEGLEARALRQLAEGAQLRSEAADRLLVQAGEAGSVLYLVMEGLLASETGHRTASRAAPVTLLRPGDLFDPLVVLLGEAHAGTVRTRTPVLLGEFDHDLLLRLFRADLASFVRVGQNLARLRRLRPAAARPVLGGGEAEGPDEEVLRQMRFVFPGTPLRA